LSASLASIARDAELAATAVLVAVPISVPQLRRVLQFDRAAAESLNDVGALRKAASLSAGAILADSR
jgi:hypothetical protein